MRERNSKREVCGMEGGSRETDALSNRPYKATYCLYAFKTCVSF